METNSTNASQSPLIINYLTLRQNIGLLAFILPPLLAIGGFLLGDCRSIQPSISQYYYTVMGDVFVGVICGIALFLFAYRGYEPQDRIISNVAAACALGIAFFPTYIDQNPFPDCNFDSVANTAINGKIHFGCAAAFFGLLAYFSMVLFTKSSTVPTPEKRYRNRIYRICGIIIIVCMILMTIVFNIKSVGELFVNFQPIFILETIALWAFGLSWLVKGEFILKDK